MKGRDDASDTTNRRAVLQTIGASALTASLFGGLASAAHTTPDDAGYGADDCATVEVEYECQASGCHCSNPDCECQQFNMRRECCLDENGDHRYCSGWTFVNCCHPC